MPDKPDFKHRFQCWVCFFRGDEADLLRYFFPRENYDTRLERLAALRKEYKAQQQASAAMDAPSARSEGRSHFSLRGSGSKPRQRDVSSLPAAFASLSEEERAAVLLAHKVVAREQVNFYGLAIHCMEFENWVKEATEEYHKREAEKKERLQEERCKRSIRPVRSKSHGKK
jgi:hypothetical protein